MSATTKIQWTDKTWNPVRGCSVVSPGCVNCYAMKQAHRFSAVGGPYDGLTKQTKAGPQWTGKVRLVKEALLEPLSWRKPALVFVNSMSDLFHEGVQDEFIDQVFGMMACAPQHTFQVLTKRAGRLRAWAVSRDASRIHEAAKAVLGYHHPKRRAVNRWPLPNVWLGVSVEDQQRADERIPLLLETPAAVRFLSCEPLLGGIDIAKHRPGANRLWVIVGGESGPRARPVQMWWIRNLVAQCRDADVPVFVKQLGSNAQERCSNCGRDIGRGVTGGFVNICGATHAELVLEMMAVRDRKGGDMSEWPEDLRVRQFPGRAA